MSRTRLSLRSASLSLLAASTIFFNSCGTTDTPPDEAVIYDFSPNMNYGGQTVRLLLADSLMKMITAVRNPGAAPVSKGQLEAIFDNTNALFAEIATSKKLSDKVSGMVNPLMGEQLRAWFDSIATRSATYAGSLDAVTTADGHYLPEMIEKSIMGSVLYAQAIDYLRNKVPVADNITPKAGEGTAQEHNWDEAFGYFGASRNYAELTSFAERRASFDWSGDGKVDPSSERNFYFARYAATADSLHTTYTSKGSPGLGNEIVKNFIDGRKAISEDNTSDLASITAKILTAWDKVIAANAVRYGNAIKTRLEASEGITSQWAELKLFVDMTQYNNQNLLGAANYATVKALIGEKPADITTEKLDQIITIIKNAYSF